MASIMEFTVADEAAASIDSSGACSHPCSNHTPLGLAKAEADDLSRYDPEALEKLVGLGVAVHEVEIDDFDTIGSLSHLPIIRQVDHRNHKKLHKHAIAVRLNCSVLVGQNSKERDYVTSLCQAFGNPFSVI